MSEDNVKLGIRQPWVSFGSDAESAAPEGVFLKPARILARTELRAPVRSLRARREGDHASRGDRAPDAYAGRELEARGSWLPRCRLLRRRRGLRPGEDPGSRDLRQPHSCDRRERRLRQWCARVRNKKAPKQQPHRSAAGLRRHRGEAMKASANTSDVSLVLGRCVHRPGRCGSRLGIGLLEISLAFGLTVLTMAYAIGHIASFTSIPPVTVGLCAGGRPRGNPRPPRLAGPRCDHGERVLYVIASGKAGFDVATASARTATTRARPAATRCWPPRCTEIVMTMMFLIVILGATYDSPGGSPRCAIGLGLALIHLISIPVSQHLGQPGPAPRSPSSSAARR